MIDNAAVSYKFQPKNGIECTPFIDNANDRELAEMTPFLEYLSKKPVGVWGVHNLQDVRLFAKMWNDSRIAQSQLVVYEKQLYCVIYLSLECLLSQNAVFLSRQ